MREPCRSCEFREIDWGGCRCQALAFAGLAAETDPACAKSPRHEAFAHLAEVEASEPASPLIFRRPRASTK